MNALESTNQKMFFSSPSISSSCHVAKPSKIIKKKKKMSSTVFLISFFSLSLFVDDDDQKPSACQRENKKETYREKEKRDFCASAPSGVPPYLRTLF